MHHSRSWFLLVLVGATERQGLHLYGQDGGAVRNRPRLAAMPSVLVWLVWGDRTQPFHVGMVSFNNELPS